MSVFKDYSRYYDLFYQNKNYSVEAEYVHGLLQKHCRQPLTVLNLGCGSGGHDRHLAKKGYQVTGVDISEEMLLSAREKAKGENHLSYVIGDMRSIRLNKTFDAVISLFHVMSYQVQNEDLASAFETASAHLEKDGLFLFDCWHGPGVLTERPEVRVKKVEFDKERITRIATPFMNSNENTVKVDYRVIIESESGSQDREISETHCMRYLFVPEVRHMLSAAGFELVGSYKWLSDDPLDFNCWNALFIGSKIR